MTQRITSIVFGVAVVLFLVACSADGESNPGDEDVLMVDDVHDGRVDTRMDVDPMTDVLARDDMARDVLPETSSDSVVDTTDGGDHVEDMPPIPDLDDGDVGDPDVVETIDAMPDMGDPYIGSACSIDGTTGTCLLTSDCSGDNMSVPGLCPGPADVQCCVPDTITNPIGTPCSVDGTAGTCELVTACGGGNVPVPGFCPGSASIQCCVPESTPDPVGTPCSVNGESGTCEDTTQCPVGMVSTPGFCPGPSNIQCCTMPPSMTGFMCDPMAAPQPNIGLTEAPGVGGCPAGMVPVDTFCIDQYEASLLEVLPGGTTTPWSPYLNPGTTTVRAVSIAGAVPQGYINGDQAAAACAQAGKRLCTDTEWLRACQGSSGLTFPYGATRQNGVCNDARSLHPAVEYFGTSAAWVFGQIQNRCLNQLPNGLALTGDHPGCVTQDQVFDMMGNLHEWTADPTGTFRGGFYVDTVRNGPGCLYRTTAHNTLHWDYSTGFRCCL